MDARGKAEEGLEGGHRRSAAVEAEGELIKVGLEVVVPDAVVGAAQPGLEVAKDAMDVRQELGGPLGRALGAGAMAVAQLGEGGIRRQPSVRMRVPGATVRFRKPTSERAEASGTTWSRTRPAS